MEFGLSEELLVLDQLDACPYLPDRTARLPLRMPTQRLNAERLDQRLAEGDRRSGPYLYRAACPECRACEALRLDVHEFRPGRTQRRIERRGMTALAVEVGPPQVDSQRVHLFNEHRKHRGLAKPGDGLDAHDYRAFLADTCCETVEIAYRHQGQIVAVAICDRGRTSLSAVYCYFDVAFARLSPGVFSVLTHIRLCREWGQRYLYLGYYVAGSPHMSYKVNYLPHERLINGSWRQFRRVDR